MLSETCGQHGRLILDFALGRLDDEAAEEADRVLAGCPSCQEWWRRNFEGKVAAAIDAAVAEGFSCFAAPRRRRARRWLAAAAAAVLITCGGLVWRWHSSTTLRPAGMTSIQIVHEVFEPKGTLEGDLNHDGMVDASDLALALQQGKPNQS